MRARSNLSATLVVAALAVAAAGCGGSDGLSKADLDAKANAICQAGGVKIQAIPTPQDITDATQAAAYFDKVVPIVSDVTNSLVALKPADDVKDDWNAFISAQKAETAAFVTIQHKADTKDPSGLTDLQNVPKLNETVNTTATKVGAIGCSSSSSQ